MAELKYTGGVISMPEALQEKYRAEIKPILEKMGQAASPEEAEPFRLEIEAIQQRYFSGAEG